MLANNESMVSFEKTQEKHALEWSQEQGSYDIEGEEVLRWNMALPLFSNSSFGEKRIVHYYKRVEEIWKKRWENDTYSQSVEDLSLKREKSRVFTPWFVSMNGEGAYLTPHICTVQLLAQQKKGKGLTYFTYTSVLWNCKEGVPLSMKKLLSTSRQKDWVVRIIEQAENQKDLQLFRNYPALIGRNFSWNHSFFTKNEIIFYFPQGTIAPWEEGIVKIPLVKTENMNFL